MSTQTLPIETHGVRLVPTFTIDADSETYRLLARAAALVPGLGIHDGAVEHRRGLAGEHPGYRYLHAIVDHGRTRLSYDSLPLIADYLYRLTAQYRSYVDAWRKTGPMDSATRRHGVEMMLAHAHDAETALRAVETVLRALAPYAPIDAALYAVEHDDLEIPTTRGDHR